MTPFQRHIAKWINCKKCSCHEKRTRVIFARGSIPADVLCIGEAPGPSEDVNGKPFVGPAGHLLDYIIESANQDYGFKFCLTNLVACMPVDANGDKFTEPPADCIKICNARLVEFVRMVKPRLIVTLGKLAKVHIYGQAMFDPVDWIDQGDYLQFVDIVHPAHIVRADISNQPIMTRKCVVYLTEALGQLVPF